jgi:amino acid transporter
LLTVIALAAAGLRASASAQLVLVSLLAVVVVVAVAGSATASRVANWTPFAPHGWLSVGSAAATLMFSFAGWEAVAPLTTRFKDPARLAALPAALAVTVMLGFCGWALALPAAVALTVAWRDRAGARRHRASTCPASAPHYPESLAERELMPSR